MATFTAAKISKHQSIYSQRGCLKDCTPENLKCFKWFRIICNKMTNPHTCVTVKLSGLHSFATKQDHSAEECLNMYWKRNCPQTFTRLLPQIKTGNFAESNVMEWWGVVDGCLDLNFTTACTGCVQRNHARLFQELQTDALCDLAEVEYSWIVHYSNVVLCKRILIGVAQLWLLCAWAGRDT